MVTLSAKKIASNALLIGELFLKLGPSQQKLYTLLCTLCTPYCLYSSAHVPSTEAYASARTSLPETASRCSSLSLGRK